MPSKKPELDIAKLRTAFFEGKLEMFLNEVLADNGEIDTELIKKELEKYTTERRETLSEFAEYITKEKLPDLAILFDERADASQKEEYIKKRDWAIKRAEQILMDTAKAIATKQDIDKDKFSNYAHELTGLSLFLDQDITYKKRLWKLKQFDLMKKALCSRKEAEDWSFISDEYIQYKNAYDLRLNVENFIINARKEYSRYDH